jgi:hypothetical protein
MEVKTVKGCDAEGTTGQCLAPLKIGRHSLCASL